MRVCRGTGRLVAADRVLLTLVDGGTEELPADVILIATGATPRVMPTAVPDGERILTWAQIWGLTEIPERLYVAVAEILAFVLRAADKQSG